MRGMAGRLARAVAATGVLGACMVAQSTAAAPAASVLAATLAAAGRQHSVHYVVVSRFAGSSVTQVSDVGTTTGIQRITFSRGKTVGHCTVIVVSPGAFVYGDAFTLHNYIGMSSALAKKDGNVWLYVAKTSAAYPSLAAAVTLSSFLSELRLRAPLAEVAARQIGGVSVVGVRGKQAASTQSKLPATLYASSTGARLPVEEVVNSGSTQVKVTLSRWNEQLSIPLPTPSAPSSPKTTTTTPAQPGVVA